MARGKVQMGEEAKTVIVVGGGLAGLSAAMKLAEEGFSVKLVSVTKVKRSHSVCAQGGINAAMNTKDEQDSPWIHAYDTVKGGDFLADQPPVVEMCLSAPGIIRLMERLGCPFNRTVEGNLDFRRFGGTLYHRTAFCGASTGQQLLYALDEQVRRYEAQGRVEKYERHEFIRLITDEEGIARGCIIMDLFNMSLQVMKADAVVIASGGPGLIFRKSTNSTFCTGAANARLYMQGMHYANGEFIQIHPTAIPGEDKLRLMSESIRGEGGRVWVWGDEKKSIDLPDRSGSIQCGKKDEPWYFLEEMYPAFGNLVPRDIAAREILRVCEAGLGIDGKYQVYLDVTHLSPEKHHKLASVLEIYEKFTGEDPRKTPMRVFPAVHYSMGGAWVDWPASDDPDRNARYRQMTNIPGLFNVGESDYLYHGANRLGANSLLSCIFGGLVVGKEMGRYVANLPEAKDLSETYAHHLSIEKKRQQELFEADGKEDVYALHEELSDLMVSHVTVKRDNENLSKTYEKIKELKERFKNIRLSDHGQFANQCFAFAFRFESMLALSQVMTKGALVRNEFRGAHFKPEFPNRDDGEWLKTTIAVYEPASGEPEIHYRPVDLRYFDPVLRDYTKAKKGIPEPKIKPQHFELPL